MPARDQYPRTSCDCKQCQVGCRTMPGFLAIGDLSAIVTLAEPDSPRAFVVANFVASEGAKVGRLNELGMLETFQIPTINPAQQSDGRCVFLTSDDRCSIHAESPFGCQKADSHMPRSAMDEASSAALRELYADKLNNGPYWRTWQLLHSEGKIARPRDVRRAEFERLYAEASQ